MITILMQSYNALSFSRGVGIQTLNFKAGLRKSIKRHAQALLVKRKLFIMGKQSKDQFACVEISIENEV